MILLALLIIWGLIEPRLLDVQEEEVVVAELPQAWDGQRIAQISDWQIGMWFDNPSTAEDAVDRIIVEKPALVVLTGDYVYHRGDGEKRTAQFDELRRIVTKLVDSGIPTYAILGNHDYAAPTAKAPLDHKLADNITRVLRRAGVKVLFNEAVALRPPTETSADAPDELLYLVGIGSHFAKKDDVEAALEELPAGAPRLAIMHHPDSFLRFPPNSAPVAMAGHTHGGQIRLPGLPLFSYQTVAKEGKVHVDGWSEDYGAEGNRLYVNRGIGMSTVPIRINCKPELTLITLRRGKEDASPMAMER